VRRSNLAEIDCVSSWLLPFRRLLAPPQSFSSLLAEFVCRNHEHRARRWVRHVDHPQVATRLGLTEGDASAVATGAILHRSRQDLFHFFLNDRVAIDMGLIRRWIDVEPNRHSEILCRPKIFRDFVAIELEA
jgi:hypothetical protein